LPTSKFVINGFDDLNPLLTKPIDRSDAETAEKTQREKMKRALRKERNKGEEMGEKIIELSPFFFSQRFLCCLWVSAVNVYTDIETIYDNC
jgi:hypothetical protein